MTKLAVPFAIVLTCAPLLGQKTRYGQELPNVSPGVDYPIKIHVYGIHIRPFCTRAWCMDVIYADVVVNGKKLELRGETSSDVRLDLFHTTVLSLGDYRARFVKATSGTTPGGIGNTYDIVLPDNKILHCTVTGISE